MPLTGSGLGNLLLRRLPGEVLSRWGSRLEEVALRRDVVLHDGAKAPIHAYFPLQAVIAMNVRSSDGNESTMALVGREGLSGIGAFLGPGSGGTRSVVLVPGSALRLDAGLLRAEFERGGEVARTLLRYAQTLLTQFAQAALCSRHHSLEQQLALRIWQLQRHAPDNDLLLTQSDLAGMLGVRRERINQSMSLWREAEAVVLRRGGLRVLRTDWLRRRACGCAAVIEQADESDPGRSA